jgi:3,4-dihydroxy 2-butanone 4-phosphate synthase/GTP cyclohydrolase II
MARLPDLIEFGREHNIKIGTIADLIHYRSRTESLVSRVSERDIETVHGKFRLIVYADKIGQATHLALVKGKIKPDVEVLVRVHEPLSVIDLLDVKSASHSWNFNQALAAVSRAECGVIVLLHRPESAADLVERAQPGAIAAPQKNALRTYGIGAQILRDLKVTKMRLLAKQRRMPSMAGFDLQVTGYLQPEDVVK